MNMRKNGVFMQKAKDILSLFKIQFHIYNCVVLLLLQPLTILSVMTDFFILDLPLIVCFLLMMLNSIYISTKVVKYICENRSKNK